MKLRFSLVLLGACLFRSAIALEAQTVPPLVNYQGRVAVGGINFDGSGQFKFALVDGGTNTSVQAAATANLSGAFVTSVNVTSQGVGYTSAPAVSFSGGGGSGAAATANVSSGKVISITVNNAGSGYTSAPTVIIVPPPANVVYITYWSNDGTSTAGSQPSAAVALSVTKGLYSVLLGDTSLLNMSAIPASVFLNPDVRLRVWFNDGSNGSQLLSPDQRLAPTAYLANGVITSANIANGAVGSAQLGSGLTLAGNTTGTFSGNLSGNVTGDLSGNVTGNVSGSAASFTGTLSGEVTGTQGATVISGATSTNTAGAIVRRDSGGNFSAGSITASGTFTLPATTSASVGVITQNGSSLLHSFGTNNFFAGPGAGNFTLTGGANAAGGYHTLLSDTTGGGNTANGAFALASNTTGSYNTASGLQALQSNNTGSNNTASGYYALVSNTSGQNNTASGVAALSANTTASNNTASGYYALRLNNAGYSNTAFGANALAANTTSHENTANGANALAANTMGQQNTASGANTLAVNTTGYENVAVGINALAANTAGAQNTASGSHALAANTSASSNTAYGYYALSTNTTGENNTAIGTYADVSSGGLTNATAIGCEAIATASNMVRLGDTHVTVIQGQVAFTASSDRNQKENFRPVDGAEVLRKLRGFELTSWNFIGHDPKTYRHYGPMAQDFYAAFGKDEVGIIGTETTINSGDLAGILMSAVKELAIENESLKQRLAERETKDAQRDARMAEIEERLLGRPKVQPAALRNANSASK